MKTKDKPTKLTEKQIREAVQEANQDQKKIFDEDKPTSWEFKKDDERECYKLLRKNAIKTDEGVESEWVADVFDLDSFKEFTSTLLKEQREELADEIPMLYHRWKTEVNSFYEAKKEGVLLDFPTWLEEYLKEEKKG